MLSALVDRALYTQLISIAPFESATRVCRTCGDDIQQREHIRVIERLQDLDFAHRCDRKLYKATATATAT